MPDSSQQPADGSAATSGAPASPAPDSPAAQMSEFEQIAAACLANAKKASDLILSQAQAATQQMFADAEQAKTNLENETANLMKAFQSGTFYVSPDVLLPAGSGKTEESGQPQATPSSEPPAAPAGPT